MKGKILLSLWLLLAVYFGCGTPESNENKKYGSEEWLTGTEDERWNTVAEQFAGFSATMVEVQYRYQELYWAGTDENWDYALYQIEHIEEAIEAGIQRRPERKESAHAFLLKDFTAMEKALDTRNKSDFLEGFEAFRISCNACHSKEEVPFIYVNTPSEKRTNISKPK